MRCSSDCDSPRGNCHVCIFPFPVEQGEVSGLFGPLSCGFQVSFGIMCCNHPPSMAKEMEAATAALATMAATVQQATHTLARRVTWSTGPVVWRRSRSLVHHHHGETPRMVL